MAPAACQSLHELEGHCEYCGEVCDSTQDELNAIACTFEGCPSPTIYHQHCIETYLKTIRLDKYVDLQLVLRAFWRPLTHISLQQFLQLACFCLSQA